MTREQFIEWLRSEFPRLLQEDPRFSAEVVGILSQTLGSRSEFVRLLEEIKLLREDANRRFEAAERRFEAIDRRFEAIDRWFEAIDRRFEELRQDMNRRFEVVEQTLLAHSEALRRIDRELRQLHIGFGSLGRRFGLGLEEAVRLTVEEFSGLGPLRAERLVLKDAEGEVFGVRGQAIEFDAFVHDGRRFLVEVKGFAEPEDVLVFSRKLQFARRELREPFEAVMISPFATQEAVRLARQLGIPVLPADGEDEGESHRPDRD